MALKHTWTEGEKWKPSHTAEWFGERFATKDSKGKGRKSDVKEGFDLNSTDLNVLRDHFIQFLLNNGDHDGIANAGSHTHWLSLQKSKQTKAWLLEAPCHRLRHEQVPADFQLLTAGVIWDSVLDQIRAGKRDAEKREAVRATPHSRTLEFASVLNIRIRQSGLRLEQLPPQQATLNVSNATLVFHHGLTNHAICSFPIIGMLKPRHHDDLEDSTIQEKDLKPRMLSFKVLVKKMSAKLQDDFNPAKTTIWDPIRNTRITDDEDLQSAVLQQLEAKRLSAVHLQLREPEAPKRKRIENGRVQARETRGSTHGNAGSVEGDDCYNDSSNDDDG